MFEAAIRLETARLLLRPLEMADAPRMAAIANDKRIARNLTSVFPHPYSLADAETFLGAVGDDDVAIELTTPMGSQSEGLIGVIGASPGDGEDADVFMFGYWLAADAWGHGLATEAGRAVIDHLLVTRNLRRIEAGVYGWNPASCNVLEKLGFELEGTFRNRVRRFGEVTDELMYAIVP